MKPKIMLLALLFATFSAHAKYYTFSELKGKELDGMQKLISEKLEKARGYSESESDDEDEVKKSEQDAVEELRDVLTIIFSRPDNDKLIQSLIDEPRTLLIRLKSYDEKLLNIVNNAIRMAKNKSLDVPQRLTQFFVLKNVMSYTRSELKKGSDWTVKLFETIRDADLETDAKMNQLLRKSAYTPLNVSKFAREVLKMDLKPKK